MIAAEPLLDNREAARSYRRGMRCLDGPSWWFEGTR